METLSPLRRFVYTWSLLGVVLAIFFVPIDLYLIPFQQELTMWIWGKPIGWSYTWITGHAAPHVAVFSDSLSFYLLLGWLAVATAVFVPLLLHRYDVYGVRFRAWMMLMIRLYLAMQLGRYGLAKLLKTQFYLPEPNTLYTPIGELTPDIAFWSVMGTSPTYNLVTGWLEMGCAIGLLIPLYYRSASLLSVVLLGQILLINISFDISVKGFSALLLLMALLLCAPGWRGLWSLLVPSRHNQLQASTWKVPLKSTGQQIVFLGGCLFIGLELFWAAKAHQFQWDDQVERPPLHGAYRVISNPLVDSGFAYVFFHRRNYLILRNLQGHDHRFPVHVDTLSKRYYWRIRSGEWKSGKYQYQDSGRILLLKPAPGHDSLRANVLPWESLPLLQQPFHLTIDQPAQ